MKASSKTHPSTRARGTGAKSKSRSASGGRAEAQGSKPAGRDGAAAGVAPSRDKRTRTDENDYRLLVESIRDYAVFMLDLHGRILTWGPGAERIKGYRAKEILGKHFSIFYPREDIESDKPLRELKEAAAAGRLEDEGWRLRKDGSRFWANVVITSLRDHQGNLRGFAKITRDITDKMLIQERLRAQNIRLSALIENNPLGIIFVDIEGRAQISNPAFERMFQYSSEEIMGAMVHGMIAADDSMAEWEQIAPQLQRGESFYLRTFRRRKDGAELPVELVGVPVMAPDGTLNGAYAIYRDITDSLRDEQALLESQASLRQLSAQILRLRDEQRQRVARDLHDLTSPAFASLLSKLHQLRQRHPDLEVGENAILSDAVALAESLSREIRNVSHELHPLLLDDLGLTAALRGYLAALGRRKGRDIDVELPEHGSRLPREVELALFRIVEESMDSAMGAAGSVPARVRLTVDAGELRLEVLDPGRQISSDVRRRWLAGSIADMGVGLAALRERMHQLGGRLEIDTSPAGAIVRAVWPLKPKLP